VPIINLVHKIFKSYPFGIKKGGFAIHLALIILNSPLIKSRSYTFGNGKELIPIGLAPITMYLPPKIIASCVIGIESFAFGNRKEGIARCTAPLKCNKVFKLL